jgi:hypothetical protein
VGALVAAAVALVACTSRAQPLAAPESAPASAPGLAVWTGQATLTDAPLELTLDRAPPAAVREALARPRGTLAVEIAGLRADRPSGTTYNVFVGSRRRPLPVEVGDLDYVGAFSLFDIAGRTDAMGRTLTVGAGGAGARLSRLLADPSRPLVVTLVPRGGDKAPLVIGRVRLVRIPMN